MIKKGDRVFGVDWSAFSTEARIVSTVAVSASGASVKLKNRLAPWRYRIVVMQEQCYANAADAVAAWRRDLDEKCEWHRSEIDRLTKLAAIEPADGV